MVIFNPRGSLVVDVQDNTLDDSTKEGDLKGVKMQSADMNEVVGEGIRHKA